MRKRKLAKHIQSIGHSFLCRMTFGDHYLLLYDQRWHDRALYATFRPLFIRVARQRDSAACNVSFVLILQCTPARTYMWWEEAQKKYVHMSRQTVWLTWMKCMCILAITQNINTLQEWLISMVCFTSVRKAYTHERDFTFRSKYELWLAN